jgi:enoyl-CoA hydratase/carnithine racemase
MADELADLAVEHSEGVAIVRINRPRILNALNSQTLRELIQAVRELDEDPSVRVVLLAGAGERAFSAGADLNETGTLEGESLRQFVLLDFRCKAVIAACRKPTVAAIQGYALGGGLELALACDIRLASTRAVFGFAEVELGTVPGSGGVQRLPAVVGRGIACDLLFTGRRIDAQEAWRIGLVNHLYAPEEFAAKTEAYVRELANRNPVAMQGIKAALQRDMVAAQGLEAGYHGLLALACRVGGGYRKQVDKVLKKDGGQG